jgi:hypothetical protein
VLLRVARTLLRPGAEGTRGPPLQNAPKCKTGLASDLLTFASCRFATRTYNVRATRRTRRISYGATGGRPNSGARRARHTLSIPAVKGFGTPSAVRCYMLRSPRPLRWLFSISHAANPTQLNDYGTDTFSIDLYSGRVHNYNEGKCVCFRV